MTLGHSASEPGLGKTGGSGGSTRNNLADIGASISMGGMTTTLYEKMKSESKFRDEPRIAMGVRPAGRSITVPLADSAERDVQSDIYFPAPPTPVRERRYRKISHAPGEIHVHYGLKDQKLPGEDFRYGIRSNKKETTEGAMKAGQLMGVAEYKNSVMERVYESTKKEPVGRPYIRGHNLQMLPEGFGNKSGEPSDAKIVVFPVDRKPDPEEIRLMYRKTHNNWAPGERIDRDYTFPKETFHPNFRYGKGEAQSAEGVGAKMALTYDAEDDGNYKKTKLVQSACEDYRNVQHPKVMRRTHVKQGKSGPPLPQSHRYGIKSTTSEFTARSCILGYYGLEEQLPDMDLGKCTKPGRRNVTTETRAFGVPSVRSDLPAPPPGKKSVSNPVNFGDECGCAALINPQRFDNKGVPDGEFLVRRPREELASIVTNVSYDMGEDFDDVFDEAVGLFDDGQELVSLDALLYIHQRQIDDQVVKRIAASSSAPQLRAGRA